MWCYRMLLHVKRLAVFQRGLRSNYFGQELTNFSFDRREVVNTVNQRTAFARCVLIQIQSPPWGKRRESLESRLIQIFHWPCVKCVRCSLWLVPICMFFALIGSNLSFVTPPRPRPSLWLVPTSRLSHHTITPAPANNSLRHIIFYNLVPELSFQLGSVYCIHLLSWKSLWKSVL